MFNTFDELFTQAKDIGLKVTVVCGVNYAMTGRVLGQNEKVLCLVDEGQVQIYVDRTKILFAFFSPQQQPVPAEANAQQPAPDTDTPEQ